MPVNNVKEGKEGLFSIILGCHIHIAAQMKARLRGNRASHTITSGQW